MSTSIAITPEEVQLMLDYDPTSGHFTWKIKRRGKNIGVPAGYLEKTGYRRIRIYGKPYNAHRLAWLYTHGKWPQGVIDHIDGNRDNNRINNLREATLTQNQYNRRVKCTSSTGRKGVSLARREGRYQSQITIGGVKKFIGYFDTIEEGVCAYNKAAIAAQGEFFKAS